MDQNQNETFSKLLWKTKQKKNKIHISETNKKVLIKVKALFVSFEKKSEKKLFCPYFWTPFSSIPLIQFAYYTSLSKWFWYFVLKCKKYLNILQYSSILIDTHVWANSIEFSNEKKNKHNVVAIWKWKQIAAKHENRKSYYFN